MDQCTHPIVYCINHYEIIRKYGCGVCGGVMMCECDAAFGRQFFAHQLDRAVDFQTQERIPVTLGFQPHACNACRGLPEEAHPVAEIHGRTTKVVRYYWREIIYETYPRFHTWADSHSLDWRTAMRAHRDAYHAIRREVIQLIKARHESSPKYVYSEESEAAFLSRHQVHIVKQSGRFLSRGSGRVMILDGDLLRTAEQYAASHFERQGYTVLFTESVPFHALFAVLMWLLIQDPDDPLVHPVLFGDRSACGSQEPSPIIQTFLPRDFGTVSYARRRRNAIEDHFALFDQTRRDLLSAFDYWTEPSSGLRQYLWAHRPQDIARARQIASVLPVDVITRILRYLVNSYWQHYLGWPDLLVHNDAEFFFAEVKASRDKLSEVQRAWISGNLSELHVPFRLVKIHKTGTVDLAQRFDQATD